MTATSLIRGPAHPFDDESHKVTRARRQINERRDRRMRSIAPTLRLLPVGERDHRDGHGRGRRQAVTPSTDSSAHPFRRRKLAALVTKRRPTRPTIDLRRLDSAPAPLRVRSPSKERREGNRSTDGATSERGLSIKNNTAMIFRHVRRHRGEVRSSRSFRTTP